MKIVDAERDIAGEKSAAGGAIRRRRFLFGAAPFILTSTAEGRDARRLPSQGGDRRRAATGAGRGPAQGGDRRRAATGTGRGPASSNPLALYQAVLDVVEVPSGARRRRGTKRCSTSSRRVSDKDRCGID